MAHETAEMLLEEARALPKDAVAARAKLEEAAGELMRAKVARQKAEEHAALSKIAYRKAAKAVRSARRLAAVARSRVG